MVSTTMECCTFSDEFRFKVDFADVRIRIWRKRVSGMTQNVSSSVISMVVDPSWYGQASHQNIAYNLFF